MVVYCWANLAYDGPALGQRFVFDGDSDSLGSLRIKVRIYIIFCYINLV